MQYFQDVSALLNSIQEVLENNKAANVVALDITERQSIFDYIIIATGTSSRHIITLKEKIYELCKSLDIHNLSSEGEEGGNWIIVDLDIIVVHLFRDEVREYYQIEKFWE